MLQPAPSVPQSNAYLEYGSISDENLFAVASSNTFVHHVPNITYTDEEHIIDNKDSEYRSNVSKHLPPSDATDIVHDSAAGDEMVTDGENEEAILRAKLLQSLNAKKKLAVKVRVLWY